MKKKVKNFLAKVKEVKAPLKWKSSKNSPPTQLAYITQPEIDMLVQANIHGSMNGKPNMGPKGIISLDGGGSYAEETKKKPPKKPPSSVSQGPPSGSGSSGSTSYGQSGNQNNNQQNTVDPGLQQALQNYTAPKPSDPIPGGSPYLSGVSTPMNPNQYAAATMLDAGIANIGGKPVGGTLAGAGGVNEGEFSIGSNVGVNTPVDDEDDDKLTEEEKKEKEKKDKALETAKELTNWWKKNGQGYRAYGDRKTLGGKVRNSQADVSTKIQDKLNKGYYKIVNQTVKMKDGTVKEVPMIIHASTGTPVNPYTGGIVSTQSTSDQGGAYQNDIANALGVDKSQAGVFSKEYQTGNGLSVGEMKPEHALRFLMKKNKGAFEQFFSMNKDKAGFNPFSASAISTAMGFLLNKITGPEALQVGNNLERAGWGKAIKGEDGKYTIRLTKDGAQNWSNSFNVPDYVSSEAIAKDKSKGYLSELLGTKKFPDQPIDLSNLIDVGGTVNPANVNQFNNPMFDPTDPSSPNFNQNIGNPDFVQPPDLVTPYPFVPSFTPNMNVTGTPSSFTNVGGSTTNYPAFTSDGYKIGASVANQNQIQNQSGGGQDQGQGGGGGQDPDTTTPPPGPLTFDVYGRPITYNYTGGPEQIYLGGGYKRDGQYIGSPYGYPTGGVSAYGYSKGGIANFKPYGY